MEHRLTMPLRWRDLDVLGHVNQAVYHELLEDARGELIKKVLTEVPDGGVVHTAFVLAHSELDYRHEVRLDDSPVEAVARITKVGTKSFTVAHEILVRGEVAAEGIAIIVGWDGVNRCSRELSDSERAALSA